ncbi:MAG: histidine--tRNA ligase [Gammaproteobacteria bacterium]|nr:histidine--tRNA ligase [Gammaproteobacteria bacterium]
MQSLRGMRDILPGESARWQSLEARVARLMQRFAYREIRTPIAEPTELFKRGIGEDTDVVSKEMYTFDDRSGDSITLRPENTASVVRAALQHNLVARGAQEKVFYVGPMFRYERPQRGRYRQFHQIGAEALGIAGPQVEVELIALARRLFDEMTLLPHLTLEINTLGQPPERKQHRDALVEYFAAHRAELDEDSVKRLDNGNPLRILDSKNPALQDLIEGAPKLMDYLGEESEAHFAKVKAMLEEMGQPYVVNNRLVRGLDYYWHTVFEWTTNLLGSQGTVCGGGRYDGLFEQLGGKLIPAAGWGMGMERLLELAEEVGAFDDVPQVDVYLVASGERAEVVSAAVLDCIRSDNPSLNVASATEQVSFKAQFKRADKSGAQLALVLGDDEVSAGQISIKWLRDLRDPETVALSEISNWLSVNLATQNT